MSLTRALVVPHVPTLLMEEAAGREGAVVRALRRTGETLRGEGVTLAVVATTHWQPSGPFLVDPTARHPTVTDFYGFPVELAYDPPGEPALARKLVEAGQAVGLPVEEGSHGADHGVTVPLHFLFPAADVPTVILSVSRRDLGECRWWGEAVARVLAADPRGAALLISGCLAHDLAAFRAGRSADTERFDAAVLDLLRGGHFEQLESLNPELVSLGRPEGELRDLALLGGALGGGARGDLLAYDGSLPGVGMAVVEFSPG
ncbi:MAG: hypothetical protein M0031_15440 [Thermaerobacter sp.]|jgi:aromatic ring-opening dioxygenase catalytic subunit (LigB family)|nr:hypothetical protein [Thermaerobacter sp.]